MRILVKATANVLGLKRGDVVRVEVGPMIDGLLQDGTLLWMDCPAPTFEQYETTEAVKQRVLGESTPDAGVEAVVRSEPAPDPVEVWLHEGGYPGADES